MAASKKRRRIDFDPCDSREIKKFKSDSRQSRLYQTISPRRSKIVPPITQFLDNKGQILFDLRRKSTSSKKPPNIDFNNFRPLEEIAETSQEI